ncbi:hypothetical protein GCM10020254_17510 [Streptomyces goshikiensis]
MALDKQLDWLLDDLTRRVPQVRHAVVLSNDGLVTGASAGLEREDAEHLAAVAAGLQSLAKGSGRHFRAGEVRQTMVEFDEGVLFVPGGGRGQLSVRTERRRGRHRPDRVRDDPARQPGGGTPGRHRAPDHRGLTSPVPELSTGLAGCHHSELRSSQRVIVTRGGGL